MRVKICANRTKEDVKIAVKYGADAVGFIVGVKYKTEDDISPEDARELIKCLPVFISSVLVTHLSNANDILDIHKIAPTSTIQLHDDIDVKQVQLIKASIPNVKLIKSIHIFNDTSIDKARSTSDLYDAILLDTRTDERIGGTGIVHDWTISKKIVNQLKVPVILAGGLNPNNIEEAIRYVEPYGVDVNTGVKTNGFKNEEKIKEFIHLAKNLDLKNNFIEEELKIL